MKFLGYEFSDGKVLSWALGYAPHIYDQKTHDSKPMHPPCVNIEICKGPLSVCVPSNQAECQEDRMDINSCGIITLGVIVNAVNQYP